MTLQTRQPTTHTRSSPNPSASSQPTATARSRCCGCNIHRDRTVPIHQQTRFRACSLDHRDASSMASIEGARTSPSRHARILVGSSQDCRFRSTRTALLISRRHSGALPRLLRRGSEIHRRTLRTTRINGTTLLCQDSRLQSEGTRSSGNALFLHVCCTEICTTMQDNYQAKMLGVSPFA